MLKFLRTLIMLDIIFITDDKNITYVYEIDQNFVFH